VNLRDVKKSFKANCSFQYIMVQRELENSDLKRGLKEHKRGKVNSIRKRRPLKLICYEVHCAKSVIPIFNYGIDQ
jgi:hypothetical protein